MIPSLEDRGFNYGDGLFETMVVFERKVPLLDDHLDRLALGVSVLGINICLETLRQEIVDRAKEILKKSILKLIVTRGTGGRGYAFNAEMPGQYYFRQCVWPDYPDKNVRQGIIVRLCDLRLGHQPKLAGIKHLNRLEQVLARQEWQDKRIVEGLLLDQDENVIEGVSSNLFMVKGKTLFTPKLDQCGVAGVMRAYLIKLAKQFDLQVSVVRLQLAQLQQADEIFVCNSVIGIWPVVQVIDLCDKPIGSITKALHYALAKRLHWCGSD